MSNLKNRIVDYINEIDTLQKELKVYQNSNNEISTTKNTTGTLEDSLVKRHMYNTRIMTLILVGINTRISKLSELYTIIQAMEDVKSILTPEEIEVLDSYARQSQSPVYVKEGKMVESIPNLFTIIKTKVDETPIEEFENYKKII